LPYSLFSTAAWMAVLASVVLLDVAIYLQHVMFHAVPALWRVHRMHHADLDFDVTTGARFHPIEIVLSMLIKFGLVVALGAPALAKITAAIRLLIFICNKLPKSFTARDRENSNGRGPLCSSGRAR
jgi:sterol desaturase/sphingolipid hydroxylase (fatty acid hydroxylase superfamily)